MYPNLKLQLWKTGYRQNRLAKALGMDETMLSKIVNGFREPSVELKTQISTLLNCDIAWLFKAQEHVNKYIVGDPGQRAKPRVEGPDRSIVTPARLEDDK